MAETVDDLSTPLGQNTAHRKRRFRLPFTLTQVLATFLGLVLLAFAGFAVFNKDPLGGEPMVHVALPAAKTSAAAKAAPSVPLSHEHGKTGLNQGPTGKQNTVTIIDGSSGARQEVVIPHGSADKAASGPLAVPMTGIDPRLLEKSRYGLIPVAAGSLKPFNAYAAPADRAKAAKMPVVSIVIGSLGTGTARTMDAIMKLPPAVTLAFTPYGSDRGKLAALARAQHHEILLQIPMEPYDYPDNDPGPQTLLTTLGPEQNLDRLYWHLSRLQGYAGIANFMGARFLATEAVMQPLLRQAAKRGLAFFDDGSAPRSVAASLARADGVPFARGDVDIDAVPTPVEIDRALAKLQKLAKERGYAVGTASALPVSIKQIGKWLKTLDSHGVMLVPLTTTMLKSKSA
jgi:polysaccharide deacetylase 2 family uncharacterized protein YibQ